MGQLHCNQAKYENQPCELEQYKIETYGTDGESFRTYADEVGQFTLYLPVGQYQINVASMQSPTLRKTAAYRVEPGQDKN